MILDSGVCRVYRKTNTAAAGGKPKWTDTLLHTSYYGELNFETAPARPTDSREEVGTAARIRILQHRGINNHDRVELEPFDGTGSDWRSKKLEVARAWHGTDPDNGERISDLTLEVVDP